MSLYYAERQELAKALRRYVRDESGYEDSKKIYLLGLINKFENWGLHRLEEADLDAFNEMLQEALE